jgi:polysaccharide pyruvyl transferase WcaK-like protein
MEVTADPVFLLEELSEQSELASAGRTAQQALLDSEIPSAGGPLIGVALRPWQHASERFPVEMKESLKRLATEGCRVVMLPLHHDQDRQFVESLAEGVDPRVYVLRGRLRPRVMLELTGQFDAILGMRLHSLVFAVSKCVPCAAVSYDPKVSSFVEVAGIPIAADILSPDADTICATVYDILRDKERIAGKLHERRIEQSKLARRNVELLASLLFGGPDKCA